MTVESLLERVAERWPGVRVDPSAVEQALAARELAADDPVAADVALACALAAQDPGALSVFETEVVPGIRAPLERIAGSSTDTVDEALQRAREKLLVAAAPAPPRIAEFRGRGALVAWVQVIAIREVLMLRRGERKTAPPLEDAMLAAVEADPVLALTKRSYRDDFAAAFKLALEQLEPRQRALLRLTFVEAAGTEKLAATYKVHRVTMFRWLADARAALLDGLRAAMATRLGIEGSEVDSLIRAVASSLDVGW